MKSAEQIEAGLRTKPAFGVRRGHLAITLAISIVMLLGITTCASAGNGPGLAFKMGVQTFESPATYKDTTRTRYELELSTQLFADDHLDFSLAVGGSTLGEYNDSDSYYDGDVFVEEYYSDDLSLIDVRLAARLHPLGQSGPIRPYLGRGWAISGFSIPGTTATTRRSRTPTFRARSSHSKITRKTPRPWRTGSSPSSWRA